MKIGLTYPTDLKNNANNEKNTLKISRWYHCAELNRMNVYCSRELHVYCTALLNNTKQMQYKNNKERFNRKKHQSRK